MLNNFNLLFRIFMIISRIRLGLLLSACYISIGLLYKIKGVNSMSLWCVGDNGIKE